MSYIERLKSYEMAKRELNKRVLSFKEYEREIYKLIEKLKI